MVKSKSERTKALILDRVSPVFNKKGYSATSMTDITEATGLTKGAIYGNFKDKEDLALAAFNHNVRRVMGKIRVITSDIESPLAKLFAIHNFYRTYYLHQLDFGGCPILNVGVDANNNNALLYSRVREVSRKLQSSIALIIQEGIEVGEIKGSVDPDRYGGRIFSIIEGAIFTSTLLKDDQYLKDMMNHLDSMVHTELKK